MVDSWHGGTCFIHIDIGARLVESPRLERSYEGHCLGMEAIFGGILRGAHLRDWLLLQQEFCRLHAPVGMKPALHYVVAKKIGQRK